MSFLLWQKPNVQFCFGKNPTCNECHGNGRLHCCDGLVEQQEPLGKEFEQVLFDNLRDLYARDQT